ncbi:transposase [Streptomyces pulveraceus]|uniref:transposase n=1 Tax=Streptomyces pulveraceus TaxID=68258 RepID=UPI003CD0542A
MREEKLDPLSQMMAEHKAMPFPPGFRGLGIEDPQAHARPADPDERHPLRRLHQHVSALPAPRRPTPAERLRPPRPLAGRRHLRPAHRPPAAPTPPIRRPHPDPTACLLGAQSIRTSANVLHADQGIDPAKGIVGRKRHIATDTLGLLLTVLVTAVSIHGFTAGTHLINHRNPPPPQHPTLNKAWADNGNKNKAIEHGATCGADLEIAQRTSNSSGFAVQPHRWIVEGTLVWLMRRHRLARDYETHPHRSAAVIQSAAINLMTRRLTHQNPQNWPET